jgi:hypothetical protein
MVFLSFLISILFPFALRCSSSSLLCASMKQPLWFPSVSFGFCICISLLLYFCCNLIVGRLLCFVDGGSDCDGGYDWDVDNGCNILFLSCTSSFFLRSGCTGLRGQHVFHSSSSFVVHFSHSSIISFSALCSGCASITLLMVTGRFILKYLSAFSW